MEQIYLDANVLIRSVEGPHADFLRLVRRKTVAGSRFVTSELTLAEVLPKPIADKSVELQRIYEDLLAEDGLIRTVPVDREVLRLSAWCRAETGGKLPDLIHVATAQLARCKVIVSDDTRLRVVGPIERLPLIEAEERLRQP